MTTNFQLLYTRISHDLAGVAGAIYNGAELMEESAENLQDVTPILMQSAENLIARLKFFRQTFGVPAEKTQDETKAYLKTLSAPFILHGECKTQLQKMLVLTLSGVMIYGGEIFVADSEVYGKSPRICSFPENLFSLLTGVSERATEQTISAWAAAVSAQNEERILRPEMTDKEIRIRILQKKDLEIKGAKDVV